MSSSERRRVAQLYADFRERMPVRESRISASQYLPAGRTVMSMGYCDAISYRTTIGGQARRYRHKFHKGSYPILATDGNKLFLIGGRFHVTERGIVDLTRGGKERE
jgi:hypothetical protein